MSPCPRPEPQVSPFKSLLRHAGPERAADPDRRRGLRLELGAASLAAGNLGATGRAKTHVTCYVGWDARLAAMPAAASAQLSCTRLTR